MFYIFTEVIVLTFFIGIFYFFIKLHYSRKPGWSILYIEGSQVRIFKKNFVVLSLVQANIADPDEMLHYAAFHLGLHCLPKYPFRCFRSEMG